MLSHRLQSVFMVVSEAWSGRRDLQARFLEAQVDVLNAQISGNRVILSPDEHNRLLKFGKEMGHQVNDLHGIITVKTYGRWRRKDAAGRESGRAGRPGNVTASVRALILRLGRENIRWGITSVETS